MKKTYTNKKTWALYFDGKDVTVTDNPKGYGGFNGVLINITSDEAATLLALILRRQKQDALANEEEDSFDESAD